MVYQQCTRCIMDNASDASITFDRNGCCNYCSDVLKRMPSEYFPNKEGKQQLEAVFIQIKEDCKDDPYDCIVGVSGGIDSSYILYLGHQYGLRMLAIHIDDHLDNPIAVENLKKLSEKAHTELITVEPDHEEYADLLKALFKASVPNLAVAQDNLITKALQVYAERYRVRYSLDGSNFAHESILERGEGINVLDKKYILSIHKRFGEKPLRTLDFMSLTERYLGRRMRPVKHVRPLNYLEYNLERAIATLHDFCGFEYYGGKHYESILTRFLQCYYLPVKFGVDKRKSHYSSLIMSGQMTRDGALERMKAPLYPSETMLEEDKETLAQFISVSREELDQFIQQPPKRERDYPHSILNELAPVARKFRRFLE